MFLKIILFAFLFYLIYKAAKLLMQGQKDSPKVKGKSQRQSKEQIDESKIEDAEFKEIEDRTTNKHKKGRGR